MATNFRYETTVRYADWNIGGKIVSMPVQAETCSVHDEVCSECGASYESRGLMGGLKEIMFGKVCPDCTPEPDPAYD